MEQVRHYHRVRPFVIMACEHLMPEHLQFDLRGRLIHKDECTLCYSSAKDEAGIDVCLKCFNGGCPAHSQLHFEKSGHPLVLNVRNVRIITSQSSEPQKITRLAIGKEGGAGYSPDTWDTQLSLKCMACRLPLERADDLEPLINSILISNSALMESAVGEWEMEYKPCTHTRGLVQTGGLIAEKSLAGCGDCELRANLWLCMTCGHLGCGRQAYDGSGGNGHGVAHYETSGHPLVCKMGTITPEGKASIHCYPCDEEVIDESLGLHLATFGINVFTQVKTEKTIKEMELEANLNLTLSKAIEKGKVLVPLYGPGFTGLTNLGNSCYMNSCIQMLFSFEKFVKRYYNLEHQTSCRLSDPSQCLLCQLAKLTDGLLSGRHSQMKTDPPVETEPGVFTEPEQYQDGIKPQMFKSLVAKGNKEFLSAQQQDAFEYFNFFLGVLEKLEKANGTSTLYPGNMFFFKLTSKLKCQQCRKVTYREQMANCIEVPMLVDAKEDSEDKLVSFESCLQKWGEPTEVALQCSYCQATRTFTKTSQFKTYPEVLVVMVSRFTQTDWVPKKIKTGVTVPVDTFSLEVYRHSVDPSEELLPEASAAAPQFSPAQLDAIMSMGFTELQAQHALIQTQHASPEVAIEWLLTNLDNPILSTPIVPPSQSSSASFPEENVRALEEMGFTRSHVVKALKDTGGDMDRAVDYLFSHPEEMEVVQAVEEGPTSSMFKLHGFITHLGASTHSGHYVSHIHKPPHWIYYNDNKVASTDSPPTEKGYLYFFIRV